MAFRFKINLKSIRDTYLASRGEDEEYQVIINNLIEKIEGFDDKINRFVVNKVANISTGLEKGEGSIKDLKNAASFLKLFEGVTYEEVMKSRVYNNLKELYNHYLELGGNKAIKRLKQEIKKEDSLLGKLQENKTSSQVRKDIAIPDAISYLTTIIDIDEYVNPLDKNKVYVKKIINKLKTIIDIASELRTRWDMEFQDERVKRDDYERFSKQINKIIGWIGGDSMKTKTKGIYNTTIKVSQACSPINDLKYKLKSIEESIKHPEWNIGDKTLGDFKQEKKDLLARIDKLSNDKRIVLEEFTQSNDFNDYKKMIRNLNDSIDRDIIGPLNHLISDIRRLFDNNYGPGHEFLVVREDTLESANKLGISLESILKQSEKKITDLEYFIDMNTKAREKQFYYFESIKKLIEGRANEEISILSDKALRDYLKSKEKGIQPRVNSDGILSITQHFLNELFKNDDIKLKTKGSIDKRGYGVVPVNCMFHDYTIHSLSRLKKSVDKINRTIAINKIKPSVINELEERLSVNNLTDLKVKELKNLINNGEIESHYLPHVNKLMKHYPLTKLDYNSPEITAEREEMKRLIEEFEVMSIARETMMLIAKKMELLDTSIPRKFAAIMDVRIPSLFSNNLYEWLDNNSNRLYQQGHQKKVAEARREVDSIIKSLERLQVITNKLPPSITNKIKSFPIKES